MAALLPPRPVRCDRVGRVGPAAAAPAQRSAPGWPTRPPPAGHARCSPSRRAHAPRSSTQACLRARSSSRHRWSTPQAIRFDAAARERLRREWGIGSAALRRRVHLAAQRGQAQRRAHRRSRPHARGRDAGHRRLGRGRAAPGASEPLASATGCASYPRRAGSWARCSPPATCRPSPPQPLEGLPRAIVFGQLTERPVIVSEEGPVAGLVPLGDRGLDRAGQRPFGARRLPDGLSSRPRAPLPRGGRRPRLRACPL